MSGTKTFQFTLIPRSEGEYFIPNAMFMYYDDEMQGIKGVTTQDFRFEAKPGPATAPKDDDDSSSSKPKGKVYKI